MNILRNILLALAVIVVIATVGIYFLPNNYSISNTVEINRPADLVFQQVANFNHWDKWSPWREMEPTAKISIEGAAATEGHKMSWEGEKLGSGSATLVAVAENEALVYSNHFVKPMEASAKDYWRFETMGDKTKVTWTSTGGLKFPFGRLFGLIIDNAVSKPEKKGLENLKTVCEAMPLPTSPAVIDSAAIVNPVAP